jgi:hypothetical protein
MDMFNLNLGVNLPNRLKISAWITGKLLFLSVSLKPLADEKQQ